MNDGVEQEKTSYQMFDYVDWLRDFAQVEHNNRYAEFNHDPTAGSDEEYTLAEKIENFNKERDTQFEEELIEKGMPDLKSATEKIQKIVPGYKFSCDEESFVSTHQTLHESAKKAYRDRMINAYTSDAAVDILFNVNAGSVSAVRYADYLMQEKEILPRLREGALDADHDSKKATAMQEDFQALSHKVCLDALSHRDDAMEELATDNVNPEKMVQNWAKTSARMDVYANLGSIMEDSGKYTPEEIKAAEDSVKPMVKMYNVLQTRMTLLASPVGARVDVGQLEKMTPEDQKKVVDLFPEHVVNEIKEHGLSFNATKEAAAKAQLANAFDVPEDTTFYFADVDGNPIGENAFNTLVDEKKPVLCCPTGAGEPQLVQPDTESGKLLIGEDEINNTLSISRVTPVPEKPGAFAMWWDDLMEGLGLNALRLQSCIDYKRAAFKEGNLEEYNKSLDATQKMLRNEPDRVRAGKAKMKEENPELAKPVEREEKVEAAGPDRFAEKLAETNLPQNQKDNLMILKTVVKETREHLADDLEFAGNDPEMQRTVYGKALSCFVIENRIRNGVDQMAAGKSSEMTADLQDLLKQVGHGDPVEKYNETYYNNDLMEEFFDSLTPEQGQALCSAKVTNRATRDILMKGVNFGKEKWNSLIHEDDQPVLSNSNVKDKDTQVLGN